MMSAPAARTSAGFIALTVAAVPTGMKAGVRIVAALHRDRAGAGGAVGRGDGEGEGVA